MLLHGFTHSGASWGRVVTALGERYRPIAPDIRGHASAGAQTPVTLEAVISDVAALPPAHFDLVGYSMGGRIALHVALALAERVKRLVLIGASPGLADPAQRVQRVAADERLAAELEASSIEAFVRPLGADAGAGGSARRGGRCCACRPAAQQPEWPGPRPARAGHRHLGPSVGPPGELTLPVTLVVGERDDKFRAIAGQMAAALPEARLEVVAGSGHAVHLEAPERVAELIAGPPR